MPNNPIENAARTEGADTHKLRTYFQDVDEQTVNALAEKYGHLVPPERLEHMANLPTQFETPADFVKNYRAEFGERPEPGVVGYTERGHLAHVSTGDMPGVPETVVHERLHQLADPRAEQILGTKLCEGITEDLAVETSGQEPEPGDPVAYPEARTSAHVLRNAVGDDAVEEAYFQGDTTTLKARLDEALEEGKAEKSNSAD
jgi:hypothetical protein